jgi:hypothetical protein
VSIDVLADGAVELLATTWRPTATARRALAGGAASPAVAVHNATTKPTASD